MECCFLQRDLAEIFIETLRSIIIDRPTVHPFILGDACPRTLRVSCPGHPTHRFLTEIDLDFPLVSGKGTQYDRNNNIERIWIDDAADKMILDESKIDWWAIWQLVIRLKRNLKQYSINSTQSIVHEKIFNLIVKKANLTGASFTEFNGAVSIDVRKNFNHHTHLHFNLKGD